MNYCIYLKKRKNKPFCTLRNEEITLSECNSINVENKCREYKTKNKNNSSHKNKKCTVIVKNNAFYNKNAQINGKQCAKMKTKSNKLAKLERNRFSVFTDDLEHCILCSKPREHLHEIIYGKNRINSMKYNFVIPLCANHHTGKEGIHFNRELDLYYKRLCQIYFENNIGNRIEFIKIFGRSYL